MLPARPHFALHASFARSRRERSLRELLEGRCSRLRLCRRRLQVAAPPKFLTNIMRTYVVLRDGDGDGRVCGAAGNGVLQAIPAVSVRVSAVGEGSMSLQVGTGSKHGPALFHPTVQADNTSPCDFRHLFYATCVVRSNYFGIEVFL